MAIYNVSYATRKEFEALYEKMKREAEERENEKNENREKR